MHARHLGGRPGRVVLGAVILLLVGAIGAAPVVRAEGEGDQRRFATPEEASKALIEAAEKNDSDAILAIYGPAGAELVRDASDPSVRAERTAFAAAAREKAVWQRLEDGSMELIVGRNDWPFPFLLVRDGDGWRFDAEEGLEEVLLRRIGRNELTAIRICEVYGDAQTAYASVDRDGDEVREYAQKILSSPGKRDGLYWESEGEDGVAMSPLGPSVISLEEYLEGVQGSAVPYYGYYWKILKGQGKNAPGGAYSYVINGNMIAGFALLGVPAVYRNTGVMSFIVSNHGEIFEKDLGENGIETAKSIDVFDPDDSWKPVEDAGEDEEAGA